jgi:hypothetical protein
MRHWKNMEKNTWKKNNKFTKILKLLGCSYEPNEDYALENKKRKGKKKKKHFYCDKNN